MISLIEQDHQRFRQIVRGKIRKDLRKFISRGDLLGREGGRTVSIPLHDIDIPTFRYGDNSGGVGMGEGGEGQSVSPGKGDKGQGGDQAHSNRIKPQRRRKRAGISSCTHRYGRASGHGR